MRVLRVSPLRMLGGPKLTHPNRAHRRSSRSSNEQSFSWPGGTRSSSCTSLRGVGNSLLGSSCAPDNRMRRSVCHYGSVRVY